jgi:hypothetical protein
MGYEALSLKNYIISLKISKTPSKGQYDMEIVKFRNITIGFNSKKAYISITSSQI